MTLPCVVHRCWAIPGAWTARIGKLELGRHPIDELANWAAISRSSMSSPNNSRRSR